MSGRARLRAEAVGVDFPVYGAGSRSLRRFFVHAGTGGRVGRDARNRMSVRALDDVSLAFEHGDRVAVVGANGAGKTTLLRVLAGVYEPTAGRVERRGRTASLMDVSLGLDLEATGRENLLTRGMLLGLGPREIRARAAEIAEFTELGDYLEMPAWTYSSGMLFRLGFAVCTCFEPEILLMDEWISVGDRSFVAKAEGRLARFVDSAGILLLASADEDLLLRTCSKAVLLAAGRVEAFGPVRDVLELAR